MLLLGLLCVGWIHDAEAAKQTPEQQKDQASGTGKSEPLPPSPFKEPQKRFKHIRHNSGTWNPLVDLTEIFPGNRNIDENGVFRLYDGAVGVRIRVEQA